MVVFAFSASNCAGKCVQNARRRKIRRGQKSFRIFFLAGGPKIRRFRKPNLWSYSHSVRLTVLDNAFTTPNDQKVDVAEKVSDFFLAGGAKNSEIPEPNLWSYSHSARLTVLENAFKTPNDGKFDVAKKVSEFFLWPGAKKFGDFGANVLKCSIHGLHGEAAKIKKFVAYSASLALQRVLSHPMPRNSVKRRYKSYLP